ncbi:MAG: DNA-processing protein DprA [Pseudomonadota bacterium]
MRDQSDTDRLDWLRLIRTDGVGPVTFHRVINRFGSAAAALDKLSSLKNDRNGRAFVVPSAGSIEAELEAADRIGATLILSCDQDYPQALRAIPDPPPALYIIDDGSQLTRQCIAIVGTRNASMAGRKMATNLARELGEHGYAIVSGLARGIDGEAHRGSLDAGTIAVLAGGVDVIYPPEHRELAHAIAEQGTIISERAPGAKPTARDFPRRNRLISGLALGVVVVEATERSGTLITARFALEQGRDVFAVPGSPLDARAAGPNRLIQDGACLVSSATDVIKGLEAAPTLLRRARFDEDASDIVFDEYNNGPDAIENDRSDEEDRTAASLASDLYTLLGPTPTHIDDLITATESESAHVLNAVTELLVDGKIAEAEDGCFVRLEQH